LSIVRSCLNDLLGVPEHKSSRFTQFPLVASLCLVTVRRTTDPHAFAGGYPVRCTSSLRSRPIKRHGVPRFRRLLLSSQRCVLGPGCGSQPRQRSSVKSTRSCADFLPNLAPGALSGGQAFEARCGRCGAGDLQVPSAPPRMRPQRCLAGRVSAVHPARYAHAERTRCKLQRRACGVGLGPAATLGARNPRGPR